MKRISKIALFIVLFTTFSLSCYAKGENEDRTIRREREHIRSGNKFYNEKRYADAEVEYKKAVEVNPNSMLGSYNLALSLIKQSSDGQDSIKKEAMTLLQNVATGSQNPMLRSKAFYNLGNMAFNQQQYAQSIEMYKHALRQNPDDDNARDNLRLAQLKKQEQDQNQDQNQDQKDDKKEDKKDDQQQKQDQNNEKQDKNDENKQQQPKPQQDLSKENMEQILQTMQNQEKNTQEKVNAQKPQNVRRTGNQW